MGWSHGNLTARSIRVHTDRDGFRHIFFSDFSKITSLKEEQLRSGKASFQNSDRSFNMLDDMLGVEDCFATWLLAAEIMIG